ECIGVGGRARHHHAGTGQWLRRRAGRRRTHRGSILCGVLASPSRRARTRGTSRPGPRNGSSPPSRRPPASGDARRRYHVAMQTTPTDPESLAAALERELLAEIPLARAMQLSVAAYDGATLALAAPLAPNGNDKGCAFGGSLASLMTLAGWGLAHL